MLLIDVIVLDSGDYLNCAEITAANEDDIDSTPGNSAISEDDYACAEAIPNGFIDLSLVKDWAVGPEPVIGNWNTFEIRIHNEGPSAATGVEVTDMLPEGYDYFRYSSTNGTYDVSTGIWNVSRIGSGDTEVLLIDVLILAGKELSEYTNCAEITAANEPDIDSTPGNGAVDEDDYSCVSPDFIIGEADLSIEKTIVADNLTPLVNTEISFEIRLTNEGVLDQSDITVTDILPSGYTFVNYNTSSGFYNSVTGVWELNTIESDDSEVLIIDAIVNATGDYLNCATIDLTGDSSCIAVDPIATIDLELTKDVDIFEPEAGSNVDFTINLTNEGPSNATGVEVTDLLPSGYAFVSASVTTGIYNESSGLWIVGNVESGDTETLTITANVIAFGDWLNFAEVTAANEFDIDSTPGNGDIYEDDMDSAFTMPIVELEVPDEFTPNGDGINDDFVVGGLEVLYPDFKMEIVNRWGNKVYEYQHNGDPGTEPIWWDGYSDGRWNFSTGELPVGTYFYTIYYNNDERVPQTGWIYLKR